MTTANPNTSTCTTKRNAQRSEVWKKFLEAREAGLQPVLMDSASGFSYVALPAKEQPLQDESLSFLKQQASQPFDPDGPRFTGGWLGFLSYNFGLKRMGFKSRHVPKVPDFWFKYCDQVWAFEVTLEDGAEFLEGCEKQFLLKQVKPQMTFEEYAKKLQKIDDLLKNGETYQVNFTFPFRGDFEGDAFFLYASLFAKNPSKMCFYAEEAPWALCSNSPERLFSLHGNLLRAQPIKGTLPKTSPPDILLKDPKSYAELTMIVDLMRNDFSKVSELGSVRVPEHQAIMELKNVWHTYSTVEGTLMPDMSVVEVLEALFPGGSITGCPKQRAMKNIDELEEFSRGFYCGSAGFVSLNGEADFNILIRTATVFKEKGEVEFAAGGGIVLDSEPLSEYQEVLDKAKVFLSLTQTFEPVVYETLRTFRGSLSLLDKHQARLDSVCDKLQIPRPDLESLLWPLVSRLGVFGEQRDLRLLVLVNQEGEVEIKQEILPWWKSFLYPETWNFTFADYERENPTEKRFDSKKTQLREESGAQEVLLVDKDGFIREGSLSNVWFIKGQQLVTPPLGDVLPGIARGLILAAAKELEISVTERPVSLKEWESGVFEGLFLSNSIRGIVWTQKGQVPELIRDLVEWIDVFLLRKKHTRFMGVLNVTPDSFSDGGLLYKEILKPQALLDRATLLIDGGADLLDVGGEASGPGSVDVSLEEELARVVPAIRLLAQHFPATQISVDTWKSEVAEAALEVGASVINDVTAGRGDEKIFELAAKADCPIILMYSKDPNARTTREEVAYEDVVQTIKEFFKERISIAKKYGVSKILLDPGMGAFVSGDPQYSYELLERIEEFNELGYPLLLGASRKGFLGEDRFGGTLATTLLLKGKVEVLRVHDVLENATVQAL